MKTFYRQASVARRCCPRTKSSRVTNSPAPALASRNAGSIPAPAEQAQTARPRPRQAHAQDVDLDERQKNCPGQKIKESLRNVPDPTQKLEIGPFEPSGELVRPLRRRQRASRCVSKRDRPSREKSDRDQKPDKMRGMKKYSPASSLPKHREHDAVKE